MQKGVCEVKLTKRDAHLGNKDFEWDRKATSLTKVTQRRNYTTIIALYF